MDQAQDPFDLIKRIFEFGSYPKSLLDSELTPSHPVGPVEVFNLIF